MDAKRFDSWTRNRALRLSRRNALRLAAVGGTAALAIGPRESLAQTTCGVTVHGKTLGGPSASKTYDGTLTYSIGANGSLTNAAFTPTSGSTAQVSGSIVERAVDLLITLGPGQLLALSGTAVEKSPTCPSAAAGILVGPQPGDLGAWQLTGTTMTQSSAPSTNPVSPTNTPISGSSCQAPSVACGPNCCPAGGTCTDTNQGICVCPDGSTQCGLNCVSSCPDGQTLDLDSCSCVSTCSPDQTECQFDNECCGGACLDGRCDACPGLMCGDMGCVEQSSDPNNCGTCGNVCGADTPLCTNGACQCIPDGQPVGSSSSSCCSQGMVKPDGTCGCSQLQEACSSVGQCCNSASGTICVGGTFAFDACCLQAGGSCASDADCCFSGAGSIPQSACIGGVCAAKN